jgi:hypothetical protein
MTRITTDDARTIAAKWKGYDGPYGVARDDDGGCVIHCEDTIVARVEDFDKHSEPLARLFADAPDDVKMLSAEVIAQAAEIEKLKTDNRSACEARDEVISMWLVDTTTQAVAALHEKIDELRAIIEGRTTPPTDAEIEAHCASGGLWRSIVPGEFILSTGDGDAEDARRTSAVQRANALIVNARGVRWWATTYDGRPCAWPVMS